MGSEGRTHPRLILVEGESDRVALETLGVAAPIVVLGGAHAIARFARGDAVGLCDAREAPLFRRALADVFVCDPDLEAELIRALGVERVEAVLAAQGDLASFRTLQKQPEWRGREPAEQLRRFFGSGARRKIRYACVLVEALGPEEVPAPLAGIIDSVRSP